MDIKSSHSFSDTVERLENAITSRDLKVIAKVEHSKGAAATGLELRPTVLVLFGHPKAGTPLMQQDQRVGLDLPLRIVVWENAEGETVLTYREPSFVSDAWELDPTPPQIGGMTKAIEAITAEAAGN
ncbi:DUF302 domain-containing protein [Kordiimonas sp. SCSIO 12603]|uniref:DUF302 domain-containing protein n=1 Tax=Kordiimonas sp. SCSIO 12603 TaxID=2829596 RepID=UPI002106F486|nr:DUF302 domain-containing protein [Kordiimonas sp. SCSIO 12603]UTW58132.1 DUF302 domain-containing protein [Kordiimonas sp. SCSIO 12603]